MQRHRATTSSSRVMKRCLVAHDWYAGVLEFHKRWWFSFCPGFSIGCKFLRHNTDPSISLPLACTMYTGTRSMPILVAPNSGHLRSRAVVRFCVRQWDVINERRILSITCPTIRCLVYPRKSRVRCCPFTSLITVGFSSHSDGHGLCYQPRLSLDCAGF